MKTRVFRVSHLFNSPHKTGAVANATRPGCICDTFMVLLCVLGTISRRLCWICGQNSANDYNQVPSHKLKNSPKTPRWRENKAPLGSVNRICIVLYCNKLYFVFSDLSMIRRQNVKNPRNFFNLTSQPCVWRNSS